eukprot:404478-Rhodomonas_salina.5
MQRSERSKFYTEIQDVREKGWTTPWSKEYELPDAPDGAEPARRSRYKDISSANVLPVNPALIQLMALPGNSKTRIPSRRTWQRSMPPNTLMGHRAPPSKGRKVRQDSSDHLAEPRRR